jgi:hypothetical protein
MQARVCGVNYSCLKGGRRKGRHAVKRLGLVFGPVRVDPKVLPSRLPLGARYEMASKKPAPIGGAGSTIEPQHTAPHGWQMGEGCEVHRRIVADCFYLIIKTGNRYLTRLSPIYSFTRPDSLIITTDLHLPISRLSSLLRLGVRLESRPQA